MAAGAARHLLNPLATREQVKASPSSLDGVDDVLESDLRTYGALLIQQAGIHLKCPQVLLTTASVLFHRFFYVSSMKNFGVKDIAAAALFVSSKLEEHPIRIRDLINCFDYLLKLVEWERSQLVSSSSASASFRYTPMDYFAKEFYDFKDDIVIAESQILKRLGFSATVQNPYGNIVNYLQVLTLTDHPTIPQTAWSFANDALLTPLLAIYPPNYISVTAIYLSCLLASPQITLPSPWWELFDVPDEGDVHEIARTLLQLYERWVGDTAFLTQENNDGQSPQDSGAQTGRSHVLQRRTVWHRAAELDLPITKEQVRSRLLQSSKAP